MSVGAAPNLSGGLWMEGMSTTSMSTGNGNAPTGPSADCKSSGGGGGGSSSSGNGGGQCTADGGGGVTAQNTLDQQDGQGSGRTPAAASGPSTGSGGLGAVCTLVPGSITPPAVPSSGYGLVVTLFEGLPNTGNVAGFPIYCKESGVTLPSGCSGATLYAYNAGTVHINLGTFQGENCDDSSIHTYTGPNISGPASNPPQAVGQGLTRT
jgi:hypothetical protein